MPSFEIPDGPTTIALSETTVQGQPRRTGTATFSVTNNATQPLAGRFSVVTQGDAKPQWVEVMGDAQRTFAPSETQQVSVSVSVPAAAPPGDYTCRLRVVNVNDPDNDYTDGAAASFTVPTIVPHHDDGFPTWGYVAIGVALVVIVAGASFFLLRPKPLTVPDVTGMAFDAASATLTGQGFNPIRADVAPQERAPAPWSGRIRPHWPRFPRTPRT